MDAMDTGENLDDLLHHAEQLTAIIDGNIAMPRIERNLKQLLEASDQMAARTSAKDANDVRASVLLGSKGFDLQKVNQQLDTLQQMKRPIQIETETDSDIQGFLKKEYENAIMKNIEKVCTSTIEMSDKFYLNYMQKEWEEQKIKILNALVSLEEIKEMSNSSIVGDMSMSSILDSSHHVTLHPHPAATPKLYLDKTFIDKSSISTMNATEMAFAKEVVKYVDQAVNTTIRSDLTQTFCTVAQNIIGESSVIDLWTMISTLISNDMPESSHNDPLLRKGDNKLNRYFLNRSCHYLEQKFIQTMQGIVNAPIGQQITSEVIYVLVKDYLNIKTPFYTTSASNHSFNMTGSPLGPSKDVWEDGSVDGIPVWCFIFYCLRAGSPDAAITVAQKLNSNVTLKNELTQILRDYKMSEDGFLNRKTEESLRLIYQKTVRLSNDVFKKSVYSMLARCAHEEFYEIFDKVDDFLWIKLKKVSLIESTSVATQRMPTPAMSSTPKATVTTKTDCLDLAKFKREILEELGENYFEAQDQPFVYFRALFLTLQWEAAIEFLFRFESYRCYAVHIALALHEKHLIVPSQHAKLNILSRSTNDPSDVQRLNLTKLISIYTKKFAKTNTVDVVYYYYFLHDIQPTKESSDSLFNTYVSQLVRETKSYDKLLGYINTDGVRVPGAIDKFNEDVNVIITKVAFDLEKNGFFEDAVQLYDLAGNHSKVLSLLNKMLSPLVSQQKNVDTKRDKIEEFVIRIAERYCNQKCNANKELKSTFYLLIDLMTFFDYYHNQQFNEALDTIIKLNIFPFKPHDIDRKVDDFTHYPDEIRRNIPDLLLATMNILCIHYKEIKTPITKVIKKFGFIGTASSKEQLCAELREKAKSLITFAGMVPYRMPGDVNAKLIQLESSMT